uniref:Transposase of ISCARN113, ISL3 family n=1 Tax=mine drainage metagenome TaxID=410659 RepID=E6QWB0_9ZZZZ
MKDTALYEHLLGLKTPWSVKSVDLSLTDQRVVVEVILKRGQVWADPTDSTKRAHINGWTERQWRHLDTCQFETLIKARVPQLKYSDGTVEELAVPWAERYSRVTLLMEAFVVKLLHACPTTQGVCELTRLAWSTVNGIMVSAVERGMLRRNEDDVPHLGLDEKSSERGHTYVSILTDIDRSRVLDLVPERKLAAAKTLLGTLSSTQRASVKAVAMDMWPAFMSAVQTCLPQADIVHDRFHVSKYLGEAVDTVRKQEHRSLAQAGNSPLTGSKWAWLKSYADGRSSEAVSFRALNQLNLKTSRAWRIKETFTQFWSYHYTGSAKRFFDAWSNNAMRCRLEPIKKVVKMLRRHETGLLNYSRHRISNACAEGFNSAIQLIKANARGFRNFINYRARILFHCGKLDMSLG